MCIHKLKKESKTRKMPVKLLEFSYRYEKIKKIGVHHILNNKCPWPCLQIDEQASRQTDGDSNTQ